MAMTRSYLFIFLICSSSLVMAAGKRKDANKNNSTASKPSLVEGVAVAAAAASGQAGTRQPGQGAGPSGDKQPAAADADNPAAADTASEENGNWGDWMDGF